MAGRQNPCPVPGCSRNKSITSRYGVCNVHNDLFEGITFYLQQAQKEVNQARKKGGQPRERVRPSGLILPPGY